MVVYDKKENCCEIFEIKHSKERVAGQYRHLIDKDKCRQAEARFGSIQGRYVLYRGEDFQAEQGVQYRNVESFLKKLPELEILHSPENEGPELRPVLGG